MSRFALESGSSGYGDSKKLAVMSLGLLDDWVLMSLLGAAAWGLSCVIDVCFVSNGVYRKAADGPAIAGLFCVIPALASCTSLQWSGIGWAVVTVGALSGIVFLLHVYFYFHALFSLNDAVNAEIFNTLGVLLVPVLAYFLLGERLARDNYYAIGIAVIGVLVLIGFQLSRMSLISIAYLAASVITVSLLMVMQAWVLEHASYATAVWLFSFSAFVASIATFGLPTRSRARLTGMCRRFGAIFVVVQLLELAAVLSSKRATDLAPSVSLVAVLECSLPLFVLIFSWAAAGLSKPGYLPRSRRVASALVHQTTAAPSKVASIILIVAAISLVQT